ncbi:aspartate kinase [Weissella diestrammenae]|uniref:Aspartokinase n=1 Tax=Weissella diestrammenae TaxID=1162633 RepID=A0A7G9T484_9LACO|nr:aspartate kinase [Weissella diestrammenae]MCM0583436.1 aspartate kinase [Weissella diestrammenae]QNN74909.1 aspartate kinase [Weissella diestrammenae]
MKVVKFGGTSLANGAQLEKVIRIMQADSSRQVMVVSAPGKRFSNDQKVTDLMLSFAKIVLAGAEDSHIIQTIVNRYLEIAHYFKIETTELKLTLNKKLIALKQQHYPNFDYLYAAFIGHGEYLNAMVITQILNHIGCHARFMSPKALGLQTTGSPLAATLDPRSYQQMAWLTLDPQEIIVVPGFFAYDDQGYMTTFKRGGSDITGAILSHGLKPTLYENFTDVSSIFIASPKIVSHPMPINHLTYREMRELAYAGFSVLSDEAIVPVIQDSIPIQIKNTNAPDADGTLIVPQRTNDLSLLPITGIASDTRFAALYTHRYLLNSEIGFTLKLLNILYRHHISYEHMPTGIDDLSIIFDKQLSSPAQFAAMRADIARELHPDILEWYDDYAVIMVVGEGMANNPHIINDILTPLSQNNIKISMINQGASRISVMLGLPVNQAQLAVQTIYYHFFGQ